MIPVSPSETAPHRDAQGMDTWEREAGGPARLVEVPLFTSEGGPVGTAVCLVLGANMGEGEGWGLALESLGGTGGGMLFWGARALSDLDLTCPRSWVRPSRCPGLDRHAPSSRRRLQSRLLGRLCSAHCHSRPPRLLALLPPAPPVLALHRLLSLVYSPAIPSTSPSSFCHFSFSGFLLLPLFPPFSSLYKRSK